MLKYELSDWLKLSQDLKQPKRLIKFQRDLLGPIKPFKFQYGIAVLLLKVIGFPQGQGWMQKSCFQVSENRVAGHNDEISP